MFLSQKVKKITTYYKTTKRIMSNIFQDSVPKIHPPNTNLITQNLENIYTVTHTRAHTHT